MCNNNKMKIINAAPCLVFIVDNRYWLFYTQTLHVLKSYSYARLQNVIKYTSI